MKANAPVDPWRAEEDARTLMRAEEIKADKGRHSAAQKHASKTAAHAAAAAGIKAVKSPPKPAQPPKPPSSRRGK